MADSVPSCPERDITKRNPDRDLSPLTRDPGARPDGGNPPGQAAPSSRRILFNNGIFSIARGDPVQLVLAGELDFPSIPHLTAALLDAADGSGVLHIDLADVYFCDLAALRTIIGLGQDNDGQQPPRRARPVVLHNVPVHVERVLQIVGWDTTPGLTIDTGTPSTTPR